MTRHAIRRRRRYSEVFSRNEGLRRRNECRDLDDLVLELSGNAGAGGRFEYGYAWF
jgi:hypothetical protein